MRIFGAIALAALLAGCSGGVRSACGSDAGEADRASAWEDPAVVLDRYDGPTFSELGDVEVVGDRVWFCTGVQGLNVYDASNPGALLFLDRVAPSDGNQTYPRCQHLAVADDDRVYVSNRGDAISTQSFIAVFDGGAPRDLRELGSTLTSENVEGLSVAGDLLLVAAHDAGLLVFDRGAGGALNEVGRLSVGLVNPWQVRAAGDLAYVADGTGGLAVVDIADPSEPTLVTALALPGVARDLELSGDRTYVAVADPRVAQVSIEDGSPPTLLEVEDTPGSALGVAAGADAVFVADWNDVRLFDASDRDDLRSLGSEPVQVSSGHDSRVLGIAATGDVFYVGNWTELVSHRFVPGAAAPDIATSPRHLAFPDTPAGEQALGRLTVRNDGTEPLRVESVDFEPGRLALDEPFPDGGLTLAPGDEEPLVVRWSPHDGDALAGWVALLSDDPDQPRSCVPVSGNGDRIGVGDEAPADLAWVTLDGAPVRVADGLTDGPVLLAYFATW